MATRKRTKATESQVQAEAVEAAETPETPETPETVEENPLAPVELELKTGSQANSLPDKVSKEKIEAAVMDRLSRKTDSEESNPFVPQVQLDNEVKEIAKAKGFQLSRGTEIGARLLARSKRRI